MARRRAAVRRLTAEQWTVLLTGTLIAGFRGEMEQDTERRLFGNGRNAARTWHAHREVLLAEDPTPGRRPFRLVGLRAPSCGASCRPAARPPAGSRRTHRARGSPTHANGRE